MKDYTAPRMCLHVYLKIYNESIVFYQDNLFTQSPTQQAACYHSRRFLASAVSPFTPQKWTLKMTVPPGGVCIALQAYFPLGYILPC